MGITKEQTACEKTTHQTLRVEDGVGRVHGRLRLGGVTDEALGFGEGDVGGSGAVALIVRDDFDAVVLPNANAAVGRAKVDADGFSLCDRCHFDSLQFNVVVGAAISSGGAVVWECSGEEMGGEKSESFSMDLKIPPPRPRPHPTPSCLRLDRQRRRKPPTSTDCYDRRPPRAIRQSLPPFPSSPFFRDLRRGGAIERQRRRRSTVNLVDKNTRENDTRDDDGIVASPTSSTASAVVVALIFMPRPSPRNFSSLTVLIG